MGSVLKYSLIFLSCSIIGWVIELIYRRYFGENKKFINPGFLFGPYLPIYGFGGIVLYILSNFQIDNVSRFFLIAGAMTLIEYIGGYIILKYYKVRLWDYRNEKFNYQGLICFKYSLFWGILGEIFYIFLYFKIIDSVEFLYSNLSFSYFLGMFFGFFIVDIVIKFNLMNILKTAIDEIENTEFALNMDTFRLRVKERRRKINLGFRLIPTFHNINIKEIVKEISKEKIKIIKKNKNKEN